MFNADLVTLSAVILFGVALTYKISFLQKRAVGYFTLSQILLLVLVPGFIYTFIFSYMQSILSRPLNQETIVPDKFLINVILLSSLFTYGGIAIHATSKMLSETLKNEDSKANEMNTFFHLNLSHNLTISTAIAVVLGLVMLELNHQPIPDPNSITTSIIKGVLLGCSLVLAMFWYTTSNDPNYPGRWIHLKVTFMVIWLGFILLLYGIKKTDPVLKNFDLLIPVLVSFIIVASLSAVLAIRRLKRGGFGLYLYIGKIKKKLFSL